MYLQTLTLAHVWYTKMQPVWTLSKYKNEQHRKRGNNWHNKKKEGAQHKWLIRWSTRTPPKIQHGYLSKKKKKPTVKVKVNEFRNKKQFSYNLPLIFNEAISCMVCLHEQHYCRIKYNEYIDIGAEKLLHTLTFID